MGVVEGAVIHIDHPIRPPWLTLNGSNRTGFALDTPEFVALDWIGDPFHPLATLI
jgi:hypothetical protein